MWRRVGGGCVAGLMMLVSWGGATANAQGAPQTVAEKRATVDLFLAEFAGRGPGASVLVVKDGRAVVKKSYGLGEVETGTRATPKTTYRLASVSKQFTATAILLLAQRGKLSLDDALPKVFPDFPEYGRQVTVRHLLNHTSGVLAYEELMPPPEHGPVVDADVLAILMKQEKTYFAPGSQFRYSNSGYALLACIVERVSGMSYPEFLTREIFRPLGMNRAFLTQRERQTGGGRAFGYSRREGEWRRTDQSRTSFVLGDGGIYASLEDLQKWEAALEGARLLPRAVLDQMMSATTMAGEEGSSGYGYGWYVGKHGEHKAVWHSGSTIGFRNMYLRVPEKRLTVIVLTNRNDADAVGLARQVADVFLR